MVWDGARVDFFEAHNYVSVQLHAVRVGQLNKTVVLIIIHRTKLSSSFRRTTVSASNSVGSGHHSEVDNCVDRTSRKFIQLFICDNCESILLLLFSFLARCVAFTSARNARFDVILCFTHVQLYLIISREGFSAHSRRNRTVWRTCNCFRFSFAAQMFSRLLIALWIWY